MEYLFSDWQTIAGALSLLTTTIGGIFVWLGNKKMQHYTEKSKELENIGTVREEEKKLIQDMKEVNDELRAEYEKLKLTLKEVRSRNEELEKIIAVKTAENNLLLKANEKLSKSACKYIEDKKQK